MREIKFKAKRLDNGEWVEGSYHYSKDSKFHYILRLEKFYEREHENGVKGLDEMSLFKTEVSEVNPETICQYTGLKDKNGKEIWEEDIVKAFHYYWQKEMQGTVFFDKGTFMLYELLADRTKKSLRYWNDGSHDWYSMEQYDSFELEVIGNIHNTNQ